MDPLMRMMGGLALGLVSPAIAQGGRGAQADREVEHDPSPSPATADTQERPGEGLLEDSGGVRSRLAASGLLITARYASESAYNIAGGDRKLLRETGQFDVSARFDLHRLAGIEGGRVQAAITYRRGRDLGADANLGVLQQVQEVYGRGQTWRLTQFWYEQSFAKGHVAIKVGRSNPGEDFAAFSCHFQNLSFCGSPPGNIVGDYWYNWPISQWSARVRVNLANGAFAQVGGYEVNPRNLRNRLFNWHFHGARGVLVPIELGWSGTSSRTGRVSAVRIGGWYSSADADDLLLDIDRQPRLLTGLDPLRRSSRYGVWVMGQHQLTGRAENGKSVTGLSVYVNLTQTDRRTAITDNQIAAGLFHKGLIPRLPGDVLGIGVARTNVNGRAVRGRMLPIGPGGLDAEYAAEVYYSLHPTKWLELRPNLQFVNQPGGQRNAPNVGIIGLKGAIIL
ncbi:carbohydrate porin [Sphingobium sp. SCG-1]|uniref:carbohydrate porin n=1 Tax=Sphingobium sp. SCG-1 TaxID=2072936 RepID=UPI001671213D|nr:carbohydrate porin [Sphingobium sp. SCG-1]